MGSNVGSDRHSGPLKFHHAGAVQQYGARLIWFGRLVDVATILLTLYLVMLQFGLNWGADHLLMAFAFIFLFEITTSFFEIYRSWRMVRLRYEMAKLGMYWLFSSILLVFFLFLLNGFVSIPKLLIYAWLAAAFVLACLVRVATRLLLRYVRAAGYDLRRVAMVGANDVSERLMETFRTHPWMGMEVLGVFDEQRGAGKEIEGQGGVDGGIDDLVEMARRGEVDMVYIAQPLDGRYRLADIVDRFADSTVSIYYCPALSDFQLINARWENVFGQPVLSLVDSPFIGPARWLKTVEDVVLLILVGPIALLGVALIALVALVTSGRPVFFRQSRYGLDGKQFWIWKFRTMYLDDCRQDFSQATRGDPRFTPFGAILRRTSLDELPQIFNILKGEMSFIGPRPHPAELNEQMRRDIHRYMLRHKIKPGITGLAQVSGFRGETRTLDLMEKRIELDLHYIKHWSLLLDLRILFRTAFSLAGDDVY